jgi:hypothetical protein
LVTLVCFSFDSRKVITMALTANNGLPRCTSRLALMGNQPWAPILLVLDMVLNISDFMHVHILGKTYNLITECLAGI